MHEVGFNYRITDFQCAMGSNQLKKLDRFIQQRRDIARKYDESFSKIHSLIIPETQSSIEHAYHLYPLQIDFETLDIKKIDFFNKMKMSGVNLQVHYVPIHLQPFYKKKYGFNNGDFPIAENFYRNEVSLPIFPDLLIDDVSMVINNILEFIST